MNLFISANALRAAVWAELLKLRRSKVTWAILLIFAAMPVFMSLFRMGMFQERAGDILGANRIAEYFKMAEQVLALHGCIAFGFLAAWVFGREFSDRTVIDLLSLPFPRSTIVYSKCIALIAAVFILALCQFLVFCVMGIVVPLDDGFSLGYAVKAFGRYRYLAFMLAAISAPIVFVASVSRNYLLPLGVLIFAMVTANVAGNIGLAAYFPWSIPKMYIETGALSAASVVILIVTALAGVAASVAWWRYADQNR